MQTGNAEVNACAYVLPQCLVARGCTRLHGDWNPSGKCHDLLHEGLTLTKWRSVEVLLAWSADVAEAASLY